MADIEGIIRGLEVADSVKEHAIEVYRLIAQAESKAHGMPVEQIHFHEVGSMDAVADVTAVCLLMDMIAPDRVLASEIHVGSGNVRCAHGILPVPAPATAFILQGVPIYSTEVKGELCTPTGAALLKHFASFFGPMPAMMIQKTGYGMGMKDFERANCVRAFLAETEDAGQTADAVAEGSAERLAAGSAEGLKDEAAEGSAVRVSEICANLDDMTPEACGLAMQKLLDAGALDVFYTPIYMKKNRPAMMLTCLCKASDLDRMARLVLKYTTTFGVRCRQNERYVLDVSFVTRQTPWGPLKIKTGTGYGVVKSKPEYEDMVRIMEASGLSWQEVLEKV